MSASGTTTTAYKAGTSAIASSDTIVYGSPSATSGTGGTAASADVNGTMYTYNASPKGNESNSEATLVSAINANSAASKISASSKGATVTLTDSTGSNTASLSSKDSTNLTVGTATFGGGTEATSAMPSVYTLTVSSGAAARGTLTLTVKSSDATVATLSVPVTAGQTAAQVAAVISMALSANSSVTKAFGIGYTSGAASLTLTQKTASSDSTSVTVTG